MFHNVSLHGNDWKENRKDFAYVEGRISNYPERDKEIEPSTGEIIPGTTHVFEVHTVYTIPFSKAKVDEISQYFRNPLSCIVIDTTGRKYSCGLDEFKDMFYNELVSLKTGYAEYMKNSRGSKVYT